MVIFIFDLDGTITSQEALPIIAHHFKVQDDIDILTKETITGNIPFIESFIKRVYILGKLPISEVNNLLEKIHIYPKILDFIRKNKKNCIIATGNLDCWVDKLVKIIGCKCYSSRGLTKKNKIIKLTHILKKENVVLKYKKAGHKVVFIGDGNNDLEAMREADISIASGLTHEPARSVLTIADYLIYSEKALCRLLNQLY